MAINDHATSVNDQQLLAAAIKFNSIIFGLVSGIFSALVLFVLTHASLAIWGEHAGGYLGLLGVFLPGYTVTTVGSFIGAFWVFIFAGLGGLFTYWSYARMVGKDIASYVDRRGMASDPIFKPATLKLHSFASGVAPGLVVGLALFLSTSWLVIRGTADSSVHAALLSNYLPGYTVSIMGGLIGAIELFLLVMVSSTIMAAIYNKVVDIRQGKVS
jgi:hypothetical protein